MTQNVPEIPVHIGAGAGGIKPKLTQVGGRDGGRGEGGGGGDHQGRPGPPVPAGACQGGRLGETPETSQEEEGSKLMDVTA